MSRIHDIRMWRDATREQFEMDSPDSTAAAWWRDVDALLIALDAATSPFFPDLEFCRHCGYLMSLHGAADCENARQRAEVLGGMWNTCRSQTHEWGATSSRRDNSVTSRHSGSTRADLERDQ